MDRCASSSGILYGQENDYYPTHAPDDTCTSKPKSYLGAHTAPKAPWNQRAPISTPRYTRAQPSTIWHTAQ